MHLETIWRSTGTIAAALLHRIGHRLRTRTARVPLPATSSRPTRRTRHPQRECIQPIRILLPGLLAAVLATYLMTRPMQHASWALRIGIQLVMLSGLAFAAMGILPLDIGELEGRTTQYHATVWLL